MKIYNKIILIILLNIDSAIGNTKTMDEIVAIVNNQIILDSEIRDNIKMQSYRLPNLIQPNNPKKHTSSLLYQETIKQVITDKLILQSIQETKINIQPNQLKQIINCIAQLHHMSLEQFHTHLYNIGIDYEKYSLQIYSDTVKQNIFNYIAHQRAQEYISQDEINDTTKTLNNVNFDQQFKITHITFTLPVQATLDQINQTENWVKNLTKTRKINTNFQHTINTFHKKDIFHTIKIQDSAWISWEEIPIIFNQYLPIIQKNSFIGPIRSYDGIHILYIKDVRYKKFYFPVTKVKINNISLNNENKNIKEQLLNLKKQLENMQKKMQKPLQENPIKLQNNNNYEENSEWQDLNHFSPEIQNILLSLKKNEISIPIHTVLGWKLIQLQDMIILNYTEKMKEQSYLYLLNKKFNEIINNWMIELKAHAYIKICNQND